MARLPSVQGKTGNEAAAFCCTGPFDSTLVCPRPAGPCLRDNCLCIYVRDHLSSVTRERPSESAASEKAPAEALDPTKH